MSASRSPARAMIHAGVLIVLIPFVVVGFAVTADEIAGVQDPSSGGGERSSWLRELLFDRQRPRAMQTVDPASLPMARSDEGRVYTFPSGWQLELKDGFELAPSLADERALVYQDNGCMMVLDGGAREPRTIYRSWRKDSVGNTLTWSPDGRVCFQFFDCNLQLVATDPKTSQMKSLTHYVVHRNYKGGNHFEPIIRRPFVYDATTETLLYLEQDYGAPYDARIVTVDARTGGGKTLSERLDLGNYFSWHYSRKQQRLYIHEQYADSISVWDMYGKRVGTLDPPGVGVLTAFSFSPDERYLLVEPYHSVYAADSLKRVRQLPDGNEHTWSPDGRKIVFVRGPEEEVWVYDWDEVEARQLARIIAREDAPDWSYRRYGADPVWSKAGDMLAVSLHSYAGPGSGEDKVTLLFDLSEKRVVVLPCSVIGRSWSPVPHPFPVPLHTDEAEEGP